MQVPLGTWGMLYAIEIVKERHLLELHLEADVMDCILCFSKSIFKKLKTTNCLERQ